MKKVAIIFGFLMLLGFALIVIPCMGRSYNDNDSIAGFKVEEIDFHGCLMTILSHKEYDGMGKPEGLTRILRNAYILSTGLMLIEDYHFVEDYVIVVQKRFYPTKRGFELHLSVIKKDYNSVILEYRSKVFTVKEGGIFGAGNSMKIWEDENYFLEK